MMKAEYPSNIQSPASPRILTRQQTVNLSQQCDNDHLLTRTKTVDIGNNNITTKAMIEDQSCNAVSKDSESPNRLRRQASWLNEIMDPPEWVRIIQYKSNYLRNFDLTNSF